MSDAGARGASKRLCRVKRPHPPLPGSAVKPRFPVLCRPQQPRQPHCCAGLSVRDRFLFGRRANTGIPFTGQTDRLRDVWHFAYVSSPKRTNVRRSVQNCGWWCTLHRQGHCGALAPVYSSGVWSVVCVVCLFTHHFSGKEPVSATKMFFGICGVQL